MLLFLLAVAMSTAVAAPMSLTHSGRLLDVDGLPLNGDATIDVTFHSQATDGNLLWTAPSQSVDLQDGYFALELSGGTPELDSSVFAFFEVWVSTAVVGLPASSRTRLHSVPYAIQSVSSQGITVVSSQPSGTCTDGAFHFDYTASALRICVAGAWQSAVPEASDGDSLDCTCVSNVGGLDCISNQIVIWDGANNEWICSSLLANLENEFNSNEVGQELVGNDCSQAFVTNEHGETVERMTFPLKSYTVDFNSQFTTTPIVMLEILGSRNSKLYVASLTSVTTSGFSFNVQRVDDVDDPVMTCGDIRANYYAFKIIN